MAVEESDRIGRRITDARHRVGLTQAQLAAAISIDRSALAKIESGSRRVTALELSRIADTLGERIEWFIKEAPAAIVSHRNLQDPGAVSPQIDRLVEHLARNVEFTVGHDDKLRLESRQLPRPDSAAAAELAAQEARKLIGLNTGEPCAGLSIRASEIGLLPFSIDLGPEAADAASLLLRTGGVALVNGNLRVGRRRLALAHELGHYLFADEYTVDWRVAERDGDEAWESRLDRFARALLLPPQGLKAAWSAANAKANLRAAAVKIGSWYQVDMSTLARRLLELDLVSPSNAHDIRAVRTTKADIVEFNLVVAEELTPPHLAKRYVESVLRLYRSTTISAARAMDLLVDTWCEDDLPALDPLPESAIWKFVS
ncbi:helix-turn-helix domain-containing protein [Sphaerisporangium album]|uniref:Helix-turn-helix domain-containing protein n=1 Tax=Sphaerisporangium album TaxID=509200 RepID=A0A367EUT4_9ACTN|nr:XRE family transcriptional regulator [Sphaerisporangium album]RCG21886.1 helix-turn-helix domain-containing protein [Sphaerisporangium album]